VWRELDRADAKVAGIAARQHGVVSIAQLRWAGLAETSVRRRVAAGLLHRIHRGVYAVGHRKLSRKGKWMAAVLACGPGAVLSHASAAHLWSLAPKSPPSSHVTVPGTAGRANRKGIVLHRSTTLIPSDVTRRHNIPVTTIARTQRDMGWTQERTRSDLERRFLSLLRAHELPLPEVNARLGPYEVDFLWRAERLVVELDGYAYHSDRATFTSDRRRDRALQAMGFTTMRFADDELAAAPAAIAGRLRAAG
jgi:very-short-patch-repair endonuclease